MALSAVKAVQPTAEVRSYSLYIDGKWTPGRRMNGDQDHQGRHLRIPEGEYAIQRIRLYTY